MNYLIYDVETPNGRNNSICSCAWMLHDGKKEISFECQLINPQCIFDLVNMSINGICENDVCDAPTFKEYWDCTLKDLFLNSTVIAHNAGFDISVTKKALEAYGVDLPKINYIDSIPVFQSLIESERYNLPTLAARYGVSYKEHDAGADVRALCDTLECLMYEKGFSDFREMFDAAAKATSNYNRNRNRAAAATKEARKAYEALLADVYWSAHEKGVDFSDIHFAFHGELQDPAIDRKNGLDKLIEHLGGHYHSNASKKIDYYVCFNDVETATYKKALALAADPANHIQVIHTEAFLKLLGYQTDTPDLDGPRLIRERKQAESASAVEADKSKKPLPTSHAFGGYDYETIYQSILRMTGDDGTNVTLNSKKIGASIFMFGSLAFSIRINSRTQCLDTGLDVAREYVDKIDGASYSRDASHFPIATSQESCAIVSEMVNAVYADRKDAQYSLGFGCCNDFIRCSDAKYCLKADDPDYLGCQYRKNLEAGRIFYGKNRNVD